MNKEITPLKSVYSYYFPETRRVIDSIDQDSVHQLLLGSITPGLDDYHRHAISAYKTHFANQLDLTPFSYEYVTAGASEGIFHLLANIKSTTDVPIYVLAGEYEGYQGYGKNLNLQVETIPNISDLRHRRIGTVFLSNPSARDGNVIPNDELDSIYESGHSVVYDATYTGLVDPTKFKLDHPSISAVVCSLSKPFGLYYYRIGFTFSKIPMPTLEVNKWFKNIHSLVIAQAVLGSLAPGELVQKYRPFQSQAISCMESRFGFRPSPSDVVLLAHQSSTPTHSHHDWSVYNRGSNYRFCLTPYFLDREKELHANS